VKISEVASSKTVNKCNHWPYEPTPKLIFLFFLGGPAHSSQASSRVGPPIVYKLQAVKKFICG
jgi:hypothetical protein